MGLSGLIGLGANAGLEDILTQQILKAKMAEAERAQRAQEAQQAERLSFDKERFTASENARQEDIQQDSIGDMRQQNDRMDARMSRLQGEDDQQSAKQELASLIASIDADESIPQHVRKAGKLSRAGYKASPDDLMSPEQIKARDDAAIALEGGKADARARAEARHRAPAAAANPGQEWVMRDGKVTPITKGSAQPGDTPYDAVASRKEGGDKGPSDYSIERNSRSLESAKSLKNKVGVFTAGPGSLAAYLPGTDARDFAAELETLKANISFNELTQMREASKTGSSLGNVSDRETSLLSSTLGALDAGQSPAALRGQLQKIEESLTRWQQALALSKAPGSGGASVQRFDAQGNQVKD